MPLCIWCNINLSRPQQKEGHWEIQDHKQNVILCVCNGLSVWYVSFCFCRLSVTLNRPAHLASPCGSCGVETRPLGGSTEPLCCRIHRVTSGVKVILLLLTEESLQEKTHTAIHRRDGVIMWMAVMRSGCRSLYLITFTKEVLSVLLLLPVFFYVYTNVCTSTAGENLWTFATSDFFHPSECYFSDLMCYFTLNLPHFSPFWQLWAFVLATSL